MKHLKLTSISCGVALLFGASAASADIVKKSDGTPVVVDQGGVGQTTLVGSDTLNEVMDSVLSQLVAAGTVKQITNYLGQGSGQGQRQMEGSPNAGTSELPCTVGGVSDSNGSPETNPGCEEIAPMSREMDKNICDDDISNPGGTGATNTSGEALAICGDGIVVISDNLSQSQYGDDAASCATATGTSPNAPDFTANANYAHAGKLRRSGTFTLDGSSTTYTISDWKDVLRVVYTGCNNDGNGGPDATCSTIDRVTRCTNPVRKTLLNHWEYLTESGALAGDSAVSCHTANCPSAADGSGGIRQAYRRDDGSGTTGVFLSLLGLGAGLGARTSWVTALPPSITPIPSTGNMFCDGGDAEGFVTDGTAASNFGDPITRPCAAEDNLCAANGKMGVVRAVRTPAGDASLFFPPNQCTAGKFAFTAFINTSFAVCPDGTKPSAGQCLLPYFQPTTGGTPESCTAGTANACLNPAQTARSVTCPSSGLCPLPADFRCLNLKTNHPVTASSADGRAYNYVNRDAHGKVQFLTAGTKPDVAAWRQHMATLTTNLSDSAKGGVIGTLPNTSFVCNDPDATRLIGCITGHTQCTLGWAGREAAGNAPDDALNEPFRLDGQQPTDANILAGPTATGYRFSRQLFISAIGGFENITADCLARGGSAQYCADEVAIASEFFNNTTRVQNACVSAGFIKKPAADCVGAQDASGTNGLCGAPASQSLNACQPQ